MGKVNHYTPTAYWYLCIVGVNFLFYRVTRLKMNQLKGFIFIAYSQFNKGIF